MKIINIEAIQQLLNDNSIGAYSIEKETDFDKLSLKSLKQLQSYVNNHPETLD